MAAMDRDAILAQVRLVTGIEDQNVTDAEIVLLINNCVDEVSIADYWPFLEASTTIDLVDSQQTYALSSEASDFEFAVALVDDDNDKTIPYIAPATFFNMYGNDTGNESTEFNFWTIWEEKIYISPIPESNDTARLTLYYYKSGTQLSTGGTSPDWHEAFHQLIVEYVKWKLSGEGRVFRSVGAGFCNIRTLLGGHEQVVCEKGQEESRYSWRRDFPPHFGRPEHPPLE